MKCRRSPGLEMASSRIPDCIGKLTSRAPCQRRSAGRTNSRNVTKAETGLPGNPNRNFSPTRPKTNGLPGRMATFQNCNSPPRASKAALTKSISPTDTPPDVTTRSHSWKAISSADCVARHCVRDQRKYFRDSTGTRDQRRQHGAVAFINLPRRQSGRPASRSSDPVASRPTTGRRPTFTWATPVAASKPIAPGVSAVPVSTSVVPFRMSSPCRRTFSPAAAASQIRTSSGRVGLNAGILLHYHCVRAAWQRRTREQPRAFAGGNLTGKGFTCRNARLDLQAHRGVSVGALHVRRAHCVAIHCRIVEARKIGWRENRFRQHAISGLSQGNYFRARRRERGEHAGQSGFQIEHALSLSKTAPDYTLNFWAM